MKIPTLLLNLAALALLPLAASAQHSNIAYQDATVRFTVITDGVVRMEYSPDGRFVDNASQVAVIRSYPQSNYKVSKGSTVTIKTPKMILRYKKNSGAFNARNLSITAPKGRKPFRWTPGTRDSLNLKGTYRTLDGCDGEINIYNKKPIPIEDGLLSRSGWTLIDDSKSYLFDQDPEWPWVTERPDTAKAQDLYFMVYADNYKQALKDYTLFAGKVPLPPRYTFGYWWSRYWSYSDTELRQTLRNFDNYNIPLDVLVIDMDWHYSDGKRGGWSGYTWDTQLFPNPGKFLKYLTDERDLKVTLNLHPADGIRSFDTPFKTMADYMGVDTARTKQIPYEGSNKKFMTGYMDKVLRPMNELGVSFWWLDWQQFLNDRRLTKLSNTWWINYVFFSYMEKNMPTRPLLYHRWGGLGNHRYQIGFSGDSQITWNSLKFQPYFNSTASNVLYGFWSHDIGGHHSNKALDPELYVRWMQFGALSPVLRTHSTKNALMNKEPWAFDNTTTSILRQIIHDRYAMTPYIYTMARQTYDEAISLCRPMYYDYPTAPEAYTRKYQYMFGDRMLVCPIGEAMKDYQSKVSVWLPEGSDWYEVSTGTLLKGNQTIERTFLLNEYPLYVKAGSILPYLTNTPGNLRKNNEPITLNVYPGADSATFNLYEDAGDSKDYATQFATTQLSQQRSGNTLRVTISPRRGSYQGMPATRRWTVKVLCSEMPTGVSVNGTDARYSYDAHELALIVELPEASASEKQTVSISYPDGIFDLADGTLGNMKRASNALIEFKKAKGYPARDDRFFAMETVIEAINYNPENLRTIVGNFRANFRKLPEILKEKQYSEENVSWFLRKLGM